MSDRRLATLASLAALTALVYAMVAVRVVYTGSEHYGALVWNLFLAWLPLVVALAVYDGYRRGAGAPLLLPGAGLWLLFFPNAPYIVTDLKHLRSWTGAPIWFDAVLVCAAAWTGLALGFASLYLMQSVARRLVGSFNAWLFAVAVLALSSFGIYLGRFERWNSWDVLIQPRTLLAELGSLDHTRTAAVTILFTAFLAATYAAFYCFLAAAAPSSGNREASPGR
jgi:uncharacterized membrane protein